jgi:hypothetical protein
MGTPALYHSHMTIGGINIESMYGSDRAYLRPSLSVDSVHQVIC